MDPLIANIRHILAPAQSWSMARCARWVRVWGWRRKKLGLDISAGHARIRAVNSALGRNVADSESRTFTQVVEAEVGVDYKTAQRWVRWATLGAVTLRTIEGTAQDDLRHLDALCSARKGPAAPVIIGKWKNVEDRFHLPALGIELRLGNSESLLSKLTSESIDTVVSDQPYGVDYKDGAIDGDKDPEPIASWTAPAIARVLKPNKFAVMHGVFKRLDDGRYVDLVWRAHFDSARMPMVDIGVWDKGSPGQGGYLMHHHEQVWVFAKGSPMIWHHGEPDTWHFPRPTDSSHPTSKPVELHERQMIVFSPPGGLVLDPFCGTGATALAALRTGRRYLGIELKECWYAEAVDRISRAVDGGIASRQAA